MSRAFTLVVDDPPHLDVGPTFETLKQAEEGLTEYGSYNDIWETVCWIDDFDSVDYGCFLFRTDVSHEISYVIAEKPTDRIDTNNEACVSTEIRSKV